MVRPGIFSLLLLLGTTGFAQTPQPFPKPADSRPGEPRTTTPPPPSVKPRQPSGDESRQPAATPPADPGAPTQAQLGLPIYPAAKFLASFDAGRGQRYFIFGTTAAYNEIVTYYKTSLDKGGEQVFREPPTHMFEVGRFREESMAFPPGVTVKDWTWGGSQGYPNPKLGAQPARFPTVIMIVPPPPASTAR